MTCCRLLVVAGTRLGCKLGGVLRRVNLFGARRVCLIDKILGSRKFAEVGTNLHSRERLELRTMFTIIATAFEVTVSLGQPSFVDGRPSS